jgi:Aspartyl/Asparaginyl beta-hydroxylase
MLRIGPLQFDSFRRIAERIDIAPFAAELAAGDRLWFANTWRQEQLRVQRETQTIFLRAVDRSHASNRDINEIHECFTTQVAEYFPRLMTFLERCAARREAILQRAMIVRLKPHGRVYPHVDRGSYYTTRDRYHLVLVSPGGSEMTGVGETAIFREGEIWWLDNKRVHAARNPSPEWRIHAIFDLLPRSPAGGDKRRPLRKTTAGGQREC